MNASIPTNSDCECPIAPISALRQGHLSPHVASWSIEDLMTVSVFGGIEGRGGSGVKVKGWDVSMRWKVAVSVR